jgi:6-phosphogluconolactonase
MENKMQLHIYKTVDEVITATAEFFISEAQKAIEARGRCNVIISGGNSPKKLYGQFATTYRDKLAWVQVYFFFADERFVPFEHADNNGCMVKKSLFEPLYIGPDQIFYMETDGTPQEAAAKYAEKIKDVEFDIALLGLGDNAHTASLFPHTPVLHEQQALVKEVFLEEKNSYRITLTAPVINKAKYIGFLVYGQSKAAAVKAVLQGPKDIEKYPAQLISNASWFLDEAAASQL